MRDKRGTTDQAGAIAAYLIGRWKRGMGLLILLALTAMLAMIVVGIPMLIIGEVGNAPAWSSLRNIAIAAAIVTLPFYLTHASVLDMIGAAANAQKEGDRASSRGKSVQIRTKFGPERSSRPTSRLH